MVIFKQSRVEKDQVEVGRVFGAFLTLVDFSFWAFDDVFFMIEVIVL